MIIHKSQSHYFKVLMVLCVAFLLMTILFQNRIIVFGSAYVTGALLVYPFSYFILDIIAEVYGYKAAQHVLWLSILSFIVLGLLLKVLIDFPGIDTFSPDFTVAMAPILKIGLIDGCAIFVGQIVNIYAITRLKILTAGRFFSLRSATSTIVGDTVTCVLAIGGVFMEHVSVPLMLNIIIHELLAMFVFAIVLAIPGAIIVNLIRKAEQLNVTIVDYNPFTHNER